MTNHLHDVHMILGHDANNPPIGACCAYFGSYVCMALMSLICIPLQTVCIIFSDDHIHGFSQFLLDIV